MKKYLNVFLALCFTTLALTASAQFTCNSRTFGIRDGLPATNISGMDQDSRGLLWIATWNGLCCYDGYRFITFPGNNWWRHLSGLCRAVLRSNTDTEGKSYYVTSIGDYAFSRLLWPDLHYFVKSYSTNRFIKDFQ